MKLSMFFILLFLLSACTSKECTTNKYPYDGNYQYSASVVYNYMDYYLKGDALINSINKNNGMLSISTLNEDNTSNASFFSMIMLDKHYAIATFNTDNQTSINLKIKPQAMITYVEYKKDEHNILDYIGARIIIDALIYEDDILKFQTDYGVSIKDNQFVFKIREIRPLG